MKECTGVLLQNSYYYLFFHINNCTPDSKIVEFYKIVKWGKKGYILKQWKPKLKMLDCVWGDFYQMKSLSPSVTFQYNFFFTRCLTEKETPDGTVV